MSRKISTMSKIVLGPGHVMEDKYLLPSKLKKPTSKPVSEDVKKKKPK